MPATLVVQWLLYRASTSTDTKLTLIPILIGIGIATVTDMEVNLVGTLFALAAVLCTVIAQLFTNAHQKALDLNSMQMLHLCAPIQAVGMACLAPLFDDVTELRSKLQRPGGLGPGTAQHIALSCAFAVGVNITNFLVIGKTSALTYQVMVHFKTILLVSLGFWLFQTPVRRSNVAGLAVALLGVVLYTEVKRVGALPCRRRRGEAAVRAPLGASASPKRQSHT